MKLLRSALSAALLLLASSISFAQTSPGDMVADVPFAFVVAGRTLPPGHYIVSRANEYSLRIHDRQNQGVFAPAHSAQRSAQENSTKMVFHRYGDTYFLSEVWVAGNSIGRALPRSPAERELAGSGAERQIAVVRMGK
jgi:hypothetical protein